SGRSAYLLRHALNSPNACCSSSAFSDSVMISSPPIVIALLIFPTLLCFSQLVFHLCYCWGLLFLLAFFSPVFLALAFGFVVVAGGSNSEVWAPFSAALPFSNALIILRAYFRFSSLVPGSARGSFRSAFLLSISASSFASCSSFVSAPHLGDAATV